ncbi:fluoride efflux transporter CrcB [Halomonas korlensis]|uniref:Fluoride-specific ion channel FluC n=1 Tax=Halomonas korlensis TaxID=463301 RepID=A0A1I7K5P5_9GAMM|nr:fluoride efflux transporter CrcB [Halomonas korlensis]SFU92755.1 CrcB protein [Halomonas korlensis]
MDVEPMILLMVAAGGALGSMSRLAVGNGVSAWLGAGFPWGTLAVNLSGALLMGLLAGAVGLPGPEAPRPGWALLAVGLLGGYTTVSSFSLQTLLLWRQGRTGAALANVLVTLLAGFAALGLGVWLAGGLT